jgi:hypothetical protein
MGYEEKAMVDRIACPLLIKNSLIKKPSSFLCPKKFFKLLKRKAKYLLTLKVSSLITIMKTGLNTLASTL